MIYTIKRKTDLEYCLGIRSFDSKVVINTENIFSIERVDADNDDDYIYALRINGQIIPMAIPVHKDNDEDAFWEEIAELDKFTQKTFDEIVSIMEKERTAKVAENSSDDI